MNLLLWIVFLWVVLLVVIVIFLMRMSEKREIAKQTERLRRSANSLQDSVDRNSPSKERKK